MMTALRLLLPIALLANLALSGCGSDNDARDFATQGVLLSAAFNGVKDSSATGSANPAAISALRAALEADRQPIYFVVNPELGYSNLMAPYGQNGDVQTWSSTRYETVSLRQGMLVATRGFGADLMTATGPAITQIASAGGEANRRYFYLDGSDTTREFDYTCKLAPAGGETIQVLGRSYTARKVSESCVGPSGNFENLYWFDQRSILRQSSQMVVPNRDNLVLQRVID